MAFLRGGYGVKLKDILLGSVKVEFGAKGYGLGVGINSDKPEYFVLDLLLLSLFVAKEGVNVWYLVALLVLVFCPSFRPAVDAVTKSSIFHSGVSIASKKSEVLSDLAGPLLILVLDPDNDSPDKSNMSYKLRTGAF